jgi:hypothetical protein
MQTSTASPFLPPFPLIFRPRQCSYAHTLLPLFNRRLDLVQTFISGFALRSTLRDSCLPPMAADLDRLQRRLFSGKASLQV